jgi:hypothetical protein
MLLTILWEKPNLFGHAKESPLPVSGWKEQILKWPTNTAIKWV